MIKHTSIETANINTPPANGGEIQIIASHYYTYDMHTTYCRRSPRGSRGVVVVGGVASEEPLLLRFDLQHSACPYYVVFAFCENSDII